MIFFFYQIRVKVGEVVPAREGLRLSPLAKILYFLPLVGEVVPAREGLRLLRPLA